MFSQVTGVVHVTSELEQAARFLIGVLDFQPRYSWDGGIALENGSLVVYLTEGPAAHEKTTLQLSVGRFTDGFEELRAHPDLQFIDQPRLAPHLRCARFGAPFGFELLLLRELDEDELGLELPLDVHLEWPSDVLALMQDLLASVPQAFRPRARTRLVEAAEARALALGEVIVLEETAVGALIDITPDFQIDRLLVQLRARKVNLDQYEVILERRAPGLAAQAPRAVPAR